MLLSFLSEKFGYDDSTYDLIPRGSSSKIKLKEIGSGKTKGHHLSMIPNEADFNKALVCLLEYINRFCSFISVLVGSVAADSEAPRLPQ